MQLCKHTSVELELLSDPDMLLLFEKGIRGGVSTIITRYGKANNKYMGDDYDKDKESKYLQYLEGFCCMVEVDLEYPKKYHDLHNDYPLAPESIEVNNINKLIPNLNNKERYIIHYTNLKLYTDLGLVITKIHRAIEFSERPWLKEYIDFNTNLKESSYKLF